MHLMLGPSPVEHSCILADGARPQTAESEKVVVPEKVMVPCAAELPIIRCARLLEAVQAQA